MVSSLAPAARVFTLGLALATACSDTPDAGGTPGTSLDGGSLSSGGRPSDDGGSDASAPVGIASRLMGRIGNFMRPEFLLLDACFGSGDPVAWTGPVWRIDRTHASYGRLTRYQPIPPAAKLVRFVAHGSATCDPPLDGLADQPVTFPEVPAGEGKTWVTVTASGGIAGLDAIPFATKVFVDREAGAKAPFALRIVALDPRLGPIEAGSVPDPGYNGYDRRIANVAPGGASAYTSWEAGEGPLYFGYKVFLDGQGKSNDTGGTPLITGDRAQSEPTRRGSWSIFVAPKPDGSAGELASFCADGADAPRLCYPCGRPSCEGL